MASARARLRAELASMQQPALGPTYRHNYFVKQPLKDATRSVFAALLSVPNKCGRAFVRFDCVFDCVRCLSAGFNQAYHSICRQPHRRAKKNKRAICAYPFEGVLCRHSGWCGGTRSVAPIHPFAPLKIVNADPAEPNRTEFSNSRHCPLSRFRREKGGGAAAVTRRIHRSESQAKMCCVSSAPLFSAHTW